MLAHELVQAEIARRRHLCDDPLMHAVAAGAIERGAIDAIYRHVARRGQRQHLLQPAVCRAPTFTRTTRPAFKASSTGLMP